MNYRLMRLLARFSILRNFVVFCQTRKSKDDIVVKSSLFDIDSQDFIKKMNENGFAIGLKLPSTIINEINNYAKTHTTYADRNPNHGFIAENKIIAEDKLKKPILLSQYFNTESECPAIKKLILDPVLNQIAKLYLGSNAKFVGSNLWWTYPVDALPSDRDKHAHFFHVDLDCFKFFKFFFYLTDVSIGDGGHVCVRGSHLKKPIFKFSDYWKVRRYTDEEINLHYPEENIVEFYGEAGTGFAENTFCIHKGKTPSKNPRLILQLQYSLYDYGVTHDRKNITELHRLDITA